MRLWWKLRDMTEKLSLQEIIFMHKYVEMVEQLEKKIKFAITLLLDKFKQVIKVWKNKKRNQMDLYEKEGYL